MKRENDGTWLLNSNLKIWHDAMFHVNSTDTKWLKINSTTPQDPYHIDVVGNMKINSVKISSWNTTSNNYTTTDGKIPDHPSQFYPLLQGKQTLSILKSLIWGTAILQGAKAFHIGLVMAA